MIRPGFFGSENVSTARIWLANRVTAAAEDGVDVAIFVVAPSTSVVRTLGCPRTNPPICRVSVSCGCARFVGRVGTTRIADDDPGANRTRIFSSGILR